MLSNPHFRFLLTSHLSISDTLNNLVNLDYVVRLTTEPIPGLCSHYDCYRTNSLLFFSLSQWILKNMNIG